MEKKECVVVAPLFYNHENCCVVFMRKRTAVINERRGLVRHASSAVSSGTQYVEEAEAHSKKKAQTLPTKPTAVHDPHPKLPHFVHGRKSAPISRLFFVPLIGASCTAAGIITEFS